MAYYPAHPYTALNVAPHSYPAHPSDAVRDRTIAQFMNNVQEQVTDEGFEHYLRHTAKMPALPMPELTRQGMTEADMMFRRREKYRPLRPYDREQTLKIDSAVAVTGQGLQRKASDVIDLTETDGSGDQGRGWSALGSKRLRMEGPTEGVVVEPTNEAKREVIDLTTDEPTLEATPSTAPEPTNLTDEDEDLYNVTPKFADPKLPSEIPPLNLPAPQRSTIYEPRAPRPKKTPTPRLKKSWMGGLTQLDVQMGVKAAPTPTTAPTPATIPAIKPTIEEDLEDLDPELVAEMQAAFEEPEEEAAAHPAPTETISTVEAIVMARVQASKQEVQKTEKKRNKKKSEDISPEMQAHVDSAVAYQDWYYANQRGVEVGPEPVILPNPKLGASIGSRAKPIKGTKRRRED